MRVEALPGPRCRLGESPLWCEATHRLWWVDVLDALLFSHDPASGETQTHRIAARRLGSIALRRAGGLLLACDDGVFASDPATGARRFLVDPEPDRPDHRKNDGRVDSAGCFWIGTLRETDYAPVGALYRIAADGAATTKARGLAIPNALAFDPALGRMYYADTRAFAIMVCALDPATGAMGEPRVFARTTPPARPDGACVDAEGHLWNAEYAGGRVARYAPSGAIAEIVDLPVSHPTSCCFGGADLATLYVSTAFEPLDAPGRAREPLAGRMLACRPGPRGQTEQRALL